LALDDIMVSVRGEELVLHSVKHGKRPDLKTGFLHNYVCSDLAKLTGSSSDKAVNIKACIRV